jgi:hypothetical protein
MVYVKDMYPLVRTLLRKHYPKNMGWEIHSQDNWGYMRPDFVIEKNENSITERVVVEVKSSCKASKADIDQINKYVKSLAGGHVRITAKILVYPGSSDTSLIDDNTNNNIQIIKLKGVHCD